MRTLGLGMCVIAILAASALLDRESGVGIWIEMREDLAASAARVEALARENDAMRREIALLEAEPGAIDRAIREELDVALPGEIVVRFTPADGREADEAASAEGPGLRVRRLLAGDRESR